MTEDTANQVCDLCGEDVTTCPHCKGIITEVRTDRVYATFGSEAQEYFIELPLNCQYNLHIGHAVYLDLEKWLVKIHCPICYQTTNYPLEKRMTTTERTALDRIVKQSPFDPSEATARRRKSGATTLRWYSQRGIV